MMKRLLILLLAASCLTATSQVPDYVPTDGLVAWFPCDSSVQDLTNTYTPEVEDFDGYLHGASGEAYGALSFDGENDFIRLDGNPTFENSSFSIGLWLKTSVGEFGPIVHVGRDDGQENNGFSLGVGGTTINLPGQNLMAHFSGVGYFDVSSFIPHESWQHVCITWDSSLMTFYVQGNAAGSLETPSTFTVPSSKLYLAALSETVYQKFGGALDEIGIWNRAISEDEVMALYNASLPVMGCTDASACNFDEEATLDDGSCVSCDLVASFCGLGTIWDPNTQTCIGDGSGDINLDGCVQLNDLLDLLSAYGDCGAEESAWQCGDPLEYQGYDYETVQIGEQCWFAENLRALNYRSGNPIPSNLSNSEWIGTIEGAVSTYGEGDIPCDDSSQSVSACDESVALDEFGRLYNYYAVVDSRQLCPQNWHVGNTTDFSELIEFLGGTELAGELMRASSGWNVCAGCSGSGNNESGFNGKPGGGRSEHTGHFGYAGLSGLWWVGSIDNSSSDAFYHGMDGNSGTGIFGFSGNPNGGISIRCIQDAD